MIYELVTKIVSIDPHPRNEIKNLVDNFIQTPLEDADQKIFDSLSENDILFFDGSHRVFTNSDVTVFMLEVLPKLRPGVIVHVHDIFLPYDYPKSWSKRFYSEQYLLAAVLQNSQRYPAILPNAFICSQPDSRKKFDDLIKTRNIPLSEGIGSSFWFRVT